MPALFPIVIAERCSLTGVCVKFCSSGSGIAQSRISFLIALYRSLWNHTAARFLFRPMKGFVSQHPLPGPPGPAPFLSANLFGALALSGAIPVFKLLDFIEQKAPGEKSIEPLLASCLAFYLKTSRTV